MYKKCQLTCLKSTASRFKCLLKVLTHPLYVDLNASWGTRDSFQCVISHSIVQGHVLEM